MPSDGLWQVLGRIHYGQGSGRAVGRGGGRARGAAFCSRLCLFNSARFRRPISFISMDSRPSPAGQARPRPIAHHFGSGLARGPVVGAQLESLPRPGFIARPPPCPSPPLSTSIPLPSLLCRSSQTRTAPPLSQHRAEGAAGGRPSRASCSSPCTHPNESALSPFRPKLGT